MVDFESFKKSVFKVLTPEATGSGFTLAGIELVITNYHVVEGLREVALETFDNKRVKAKVLLADPKKDIALLQAESGLVSTGLEYKTEGSVQDRDSVIALGYPLGMSCTFTQGIVSNSQHRIQDMAYIQTDAAINPGNSGGPLLNQYGEVVGINSRKIQDAENIGFSIPIKFALENLKKWKSFGTAEYSVLCISCENQLTTPSEHCPHCGFQIDSERYFRTMDIEKVASQVEAMISFSGHDPITLRSGKNYWELVHNNDVVRIFFYTQDYFYAASPVVLLPKMNIEKLLHFINSENQFSFYLGIDKSKIFYSFRKHSSDFVLNEHFDIVKAQFKRYLDELKTLEQLLIRDFGCVPFESIQDKVSS
ncbi:MAG: serine protease [Bdellovibrionaceae bacterium]|nr:serine protease [Pseudobdellovibrionaceae bacterium]